MLLPLLLEPQLPGLRQEQEEEEEEVGRPGPELLLPEPELQPGKEPPLRCCRHRQNL